MIQLIFIIYDALYKTSNLRRSFGVPVTKLSDLTCNVECGCMENKQERFAIGSKMDCLALFVNGKRFFDFKKNLNFAGFIFLPV